MLKIFFVPKRKVQKKIRKTFAVFLVFNLVFFQSFPLFLARAEEGAPEQKNQDENIEKNIEDEKADDASAGKAKEAEEEKGEEAPGDESEENNKKQEETAEHQNEQESLPFQEGEIKEIRSEDKNQSEECQDNEKCPEISIENVNVSEILDNIETSAETGENEIVKTSSEKPEEEGILETEGDSKTEGEKEGETSSISAGEAVSESAAVNDINKNAVGENGNIQNLDVYGQYLEDINLLSEFEKILEKAKEDAKNGQPILDIVIENVNKALVENKIETSAETGGNVIEEGGGDSQIKTGDATAVSLLVNFINTNIVGNNWLFFTLNIFGSWTGDLIVPGEGLLETPETQKFSQIDIKNENEAIVQNNVKTLANTGENSVISGGGGSQIETGEAVSETTVKNVVNTNIVKDNWFFLLINNMGSWTGKLLGWGREEKNILEYDFESRENESTPAGSLAVTNQNGASLKNDIMTAANTGGNSILGSSEENSIITGGAYALSKVFNMVNTNIIGSNWIFAVVNNMGDWQGNVEFSYPDLAVSISDGKEKASFGEELNYFIRVKNIGKASCEKILVTAQAEGKSKTWEVPGLSSGEEKEFAFSILAPEISGNFAAAAIVQTETKELNLENNSARDETLLEEKKKFSEELDLGDFYGNSGWESEISISRSSTSSGNLRPGDRVKNSILIENSGESDISGVVLRDAMLEDTGQEAVRYEWPIGKMKAGRKILVEYEMIVNNPGRSLSVAYEAQARGEDEEGEEVASKKVRDFFTIFGFLGAAQAAETDEGEIISAVYDEGDFPGQILGTGVSEAARKFPVIFWILAAISYALAVNWAYFPMKKRPLG